MGGNQEKILETIRMQGPVLPAKIAKILNTNILLASAQLSELVDSKKIHYSHTKVGGSPVYYLKGQEPRLQELYTNLNDKEKQAYDELKSKKVLKDLNLSPLMRVALRSIKDFAVPINVNHDNKTELFWKWYLLSNEEAAKLIKTSYETQQQTKENIEQKQQQLENAKQAELEKQKQEQEKAAQAEQERQKQEQEKAAQAEQERQKQELEKAKQEEKIRQQKLKLEKEKEKLEQEKRKIEQEKHKKAEKQQLLKKIKPRLITAAAPKGDDPFFQQITTYLVKRNIQILSYEVIKKKKEINLAITVPSAIGPIEYFCIAKKKRKISDSDLNAVFVQGRLKKRPTLFLTTGTLSKKAAAKLADELKEIVINKIE